MSTPSLKGCTEIYQWNQNGDHPLDNCAWLINPIASGPSPQQKFRSEGKLVRYYRTPEGDGAKVCEQCFSTMHNHGWIDSGGDGQVVCPGDWIATLADGTHAVVSGQALQDQIAFLGRDTVPTSSS